MDLAAIRARLSGTTGPTYWRSLEEIAGTPEFLAFLHREFPQNASEFTDPVGRRRFLTLMGASLALAGVGACTRQPPEKIVPYVQAPEEIVPGKPLFFATAMPLAGTAMGLLVESHMGRPTKVEGNPDHPASMGATDAYSQASVLSLYDPDRSQVITWRGEVRPWGSFLASIQSAMAGQRLRQGAGLRILTETVTSPSVADHITTLLAELPQARWHQYEPTAGAGARDVNRVYRFEGADVILSLDADFLNCGAGHVRYAREFAARRRPEHAAGMNRLYLVESWPTTTGSKADHRLPLRSRDVEAFASAVAAAVGVGAASAGRAAPLQAAREWIPAVARDLQAHRGRCLVIAGAYQSAAVHTLADAMNQALGNVDRTVLFTEPVEAQPVDHRQSLGELVADMDVGRVEVLAILGGNPAYTAPADLRFRERLGKVGLRVHSSLHHDETSELCDWHVPEAHYLESWGDARGHDGTVSILQPLIAPLYGGRSMHELLAAFGSNADRKGYDIVRDYWMKRVAAPPGDDTFWRTSVHDGLVRDSAAKPAAVPAANAAAPAATDASGRQGDGEFEVVFRPDPSVFDGRFANNAWLQELPKPLTKLTWENAVHVSPHDAERLGLANGDEVTVEYRHRSVTGPIWVMPGHAAGSITLTLGYGRTRAGSVGTGIGYDAYRIRTSDAPWFGAGAKLQKTGARHALATTQGHFSMESRNVVRSATLEHFRKDPHFARELAHEPPKTLTLYPHHEYTGYAWGMAIDLNACHGCNACVVGCQAENNIPVVGKDQVIRGREMHWLRVDTYFAGSLDNPDAYHQPMMCVHCENAPCEVVCPVAATVHSDEGLNDMVYNRCVGTRYCSNNCPYKVRRFNFFLYADFTTPSTKLLQNPDVTVRSRGVMEKCTYCVQRINSAKIEAEKQDRPVRDGEIVTACQAACPADAIVFGNINDPRSRVAQLKAQERSYHVLGDLNVRPRTSHLAAIRNPNPEIEERRG